jgi:hypothetical protein
VGYPHARQRGVLRIRWPGHVDLRGATPCWQVVWAFASLRDVATHRADVVDPDIRRAVGPLDEGRFLMSPAGSSGQICPLTPCGSSTVASTAHASPPTTTTWRGGMSWTHSSMLSRSSTPAMVS